MTTPILTHDPMALNWPLRIAAGDPDIAIEILRGMPLILARFPQITVADFWQLTVAEFLALLQPEE